MTERHPLEPFFPAGAETLVLGSFPPPRARWSMEFFYPNLQNDFWRILGNVFFQELDYFLSRPSGKFSEDPAQKPPVHEVNWGTERENDSVIGKNPRADGRGETSVRRVDKVRKIKGRFDKEKIVAFLTERKIALYDAAVEVIRTKGNASDESLSVVKPLDLAETLRKLSDCRLVIVTGGKAAETLWPQWAPGEPISKIPKPGMFRDFAIAGRTVRLARVCSPSRAYPLPLERKVEVYRKIFLFRGEMERRPPSAKSVGDEAGLNAMK